MEGEQILAMVYVVRMDGLKARFDKSRIIQSCLRAGVDFPVAEKIADIIERKIYDGITTDKIMHFVHSLLKEEKESAAYRYDLKRALSELDPAIFEFEWYVTRLLQILGHDAHHSPNPKIRGYCVDHEIDVVINDPEGVILVECKHHFKSRAYTGLDAPMRQWARLEDVMHGFSAKTPGATNAVEGWVITNTKFSDHAKQYASCKGIRLIGWDYPETMGINDLIEKSEAYPLTIFRTLSLEQRKRLLQKNMYTTRCVSRAADVVLKASGLTERAIKTLKEQISLLSKHPRDP